MRRRSRFPDRVDRVVRDRCDRGCEDMHSLKRALKALEHQAPALSSFGAEQLRGLIEGTGRSANSWCRDNCQKRLRNIARDLVPHLQDLIFSNNPSGERERRDRPGRAVREPDRPMAGFFDESFSARFSALRRDEVLGDLLEIEDLVDDGTGIRRIRVAEVLHQHNRLLEAFGLHFPADFDPATATDGFTFAAVNEDLGFLVEFGRTKPIHLDRYKNEEALLRLESITMRLRAARIICTPSEDRLDRVDQVKTLLRMAVVLEAKQIVDRRDTVASRGTALEELPDPTMLRTAEGKAVVQVRALYDVYRGNIGPGLEFLKEVFDRGGSFLTM